MVRMVRREDTYPGNKTCGSCSVQTMGASGQGNQHRVQMSLNIAARRVVGARLTPDSAEELMRIDVSEFV